MFGDCEWCLLDSATFAEIRENSSTTELGIVGAASFLLQRSHRQCSDQQHQVRNQQDHAAEPDPLKRPGGCRVVQRTEQHLKAHQDGANHGQDGQTSQKCRHNLVRDQLISSVKVFRSCPALTPPVFRIVGKLSMVRGSAIARNLFCGRYFC